MSKLATSAKVVLGLGALVAVGFLGAMVLLVVAVKHTVVERKPVQVVDVPALVQVVPRANGGKDITVDWKLQPQPRTERFDTVQIYTYVTDANGQRVPGVDVVALWGPYFVERMRTAEAGDASMTVWPYVGGIARAYAQGPQGGAELHCTDETRVDASTQKRDVHFDCRGSLDPKVAVHFPPPPRCPPQDPLAPVFALIAPGACFGVDALELSHLALPVIHVSGDSYDDLRPWPDRKGAAPRLEIPLGKTASSLSLELNETEAPPLLGKLVSALTSALGQPDVSKSPLCSGSPTVVYKFQGPAGHARLAVDAPGCELSRASSAKLWLSN
jgi:hypothetical protein